MTMKALWAPVIKFSVDGVRSIFGRDFDAPRALKALVRSRQESSGAGDCIVGLFVSELHSSSPGGRPKTV
jgi:hypothetical protein